MPDSAATNYLLAETLFESHQYADAATEYEHTAYGYPKNDKSATAAYAGLVSYQKGEEGLPGRSKDAWHKRATDAGVKFAQTFPEHPDSAGVLTRAAEEIFAAATCRARSACRAVDPRAPAAGRCGEAAHRLDHHRAVPLRPGRIRQGGAGLHPGARSWPARDEKMRTDLNERVAASVYKQGEAKQKAGDAAGAVDDFLRVASVAPDSKIRANAQYDAATQLIILKQWPRAITVLEDFRRQFPQSPLQPEVTRKLAVAYSGGQPPGRGGRRVRAHRGDPGRGPAPCSARH